MAITGFLLLVFMTPWCLQCQMRWSTRRPVSNSIQFQCTFPAVECLASPARPTVHISTTLLESTEVSAFPAGVLGHAVDIARSSSLPTSTWTCLWGYGRHARLVLPLQRNSHPHCTCENAARSTHRNTHHTPRSRGVGTPGVIWHH